MQDNIFVPVFGAIITLRHLLQGQEALQAAVDKIPPKLRVLLPVTGGVLLTAAALQMAVPCIKARLEQR